MTIYERNHLFERRREIIHVGESHFVTHLFHDSHVLWVVLILYKPTFRSLFKIVLFLQKDTRINRKKRDGKLYGLE